MSYTIIDNFVPISVQNNLENMFQYHTSWNYSSYTSGNNQENQSSDPLVKECPQLIHQSFWNGVGDPASINLTQMVLYFLEYISGCKVNDIHKIKVNMNLLDESFKDKYHPPHADHKSNEWFSLIYYIKDSDGPTRFFNKTTRDPHPEKDLKVVGEVDPKKGRAILFKSNQMHTGTCPLKTENRLVINYVFQAEDLKIDFEKDNTSSLRYVA